ncbi:8-oxo-dGTP diphosphatase [Candidatus Pacearchaeota archaeon]|nr:8-oxo-dGTP diphosphatase [Candidatus Pacearchaeota archaeon]
MNPEQNKRTLCIVLDNKKNLLLGMKKQGKFGSGKYNGPGGGLREGETLEQCALRELAEESGIISSLQDLEKVAVFDFHFPQEEERFNQQVHVFSVNIWSGTPAESDEMVWSWFPLDSIPYDRMWDGDKCWLPKIFQGKRLKGVFYFNKDKKVRDYTLTEL